MPRMEPPITNVLDFRLGKAPAYTPSGIEIPSAITADTKTSSSVAGTRWAIRESASTL